MKVITANPVIVNNEEISRPSMYLPFVGTGISKDELKAFQVFANSKGWSPKLVVDGIWGTKTQDAINVWGNEYDKRLAGSTSTTTTTTDGGTTTTPPAPVSGGVSSGTPSVEEQTKRAKRGQIWDKTKGWVTSGKAKNFLENARGLFGGLFGGAGTTQTTDTGSQYVAPTTTPEAKKGLSKGAKIGIAVGVALVVGLIIYKVTRKK